MGRFLVAAVMTVLVTGCASSGGMVYKPQPFPMPGGGGAVAVPAPTEANNPPAAVPPPAKPGKPSPFIFTSILTAAAATWTAEDLVTAHARGLPLTNDWVLNYTPNQPPWFPEGQDPPFPYREWYVWSGSPTSRPKWILCGGWRY